jgi:uncharacterized surface protein with fasciclin (FAS1) repeats
MRTLTCSLVAAGTGLLGGPTPAQAAGDTCQAQAHPNPASMSAMAEKDIVDTAVAAGSFKTLARALQAAGLADALKGPGPFTVFAPTDEAFARLPEGTLASLLKPEGRSVLAAILTYHVVPGSLEASDVVALTQATTLNGQRIDISVDGGVKVDQATVLTADVACRNGLIHVIDRVIMPSTDTIVETAVKAGSFQTLTTAIKAAGLAATLAGEGPFTVFAPQDSAFAMLPAGTVESLLQPDNRHRLIDLLKAHVVPGRIYAADALKAQTVETLAGSRLRLALQGGSVVVNGANVVENDVEAGNGVIHVIDSVILPR